jgi:hypothetical protein
MYIHSLNDDILTVKKDESVNIGDLLCYQDIAIGRVDKITIDQVEIKIFSKAFTFKLGDNSQYFYQKKNNYFFFEYFNSILTPNGSLNQIKWETDFEFISILDEGCVVNAEDIVGYIRHNDIKYPILVPDNIHEGVLINTGPKKANYSEPINVVSYQGLNYPIHIYQNNFFDLPKVPSDDYKSLVIQNRDIDADFLKLLNNYEVIIHLSSQLSENYVQNSIVGIKEFFVRAGVNNVQSIGFNDYPYFSKDYSIIILERAENIIKQLLIRGFNIIIFFEGFYIEELVSIKALEGEYKTKSGKSSSLRLVELAN